MNVGEKEAIEKRYLRNLEGLDKSKPGGDLHGVLEKTAFYIGQLTGNPDNFKNWMNAQIALASYTLQSFPYVGCSPLGCLDLSIPEGNEDCFGISGRLKIEADQNAETYREFARFHTGMRSHIPSDFDFWMQAQDKLGRMAAKYFYQARKEADRRIIYGEDA